MKPAKVDWVCEHCGSNDVLVDAYAEWNVDTQQWEIHSTFNKGSYCRECDGECRLTEKVLP